MKADTLDLIKVEPTMRKPIYRDRDQWILCGCLDCGTPNYVEPHGTTTACKKCKRETEHVNMPYALRDISGCFYLGPAVLPSTYRLPRE